MKRFSSLAATAFLLAAPAFAESGGVNPTIFLAAIFVLACFLPQLAAAVRRLHDTGKSGAAYLISLVPFVGGIILIVWLATEGNPGANMYGEPPAK